MMPVNIVLLPPPFRSSPGLLKGIENLPVEHLISKLCIERFVVSILSRASRFEEQGLDADPTKPVPDRLSSKIRSLFDLV
jgi:hypothetical protein